ncbi:MAG: SGNH/GDSL hydrolase family protein [Gammaproteobacteria bacterium]|nr:MAG: SGNH/GDSL hydrolase family protein [Gammaproteobacteria bacterium]
MIKPAIKLTTTLCSVILITAFIIGLIILAEYTFSTGRTPLGFSFWRFDPLLGWSGEPNATGRLVSDEFNVHVQNNDQGLRDDQYPEKSDKFRVLVLGDSFAWGVGVEHEDRFTEIVERNIPGIEIINSGVIGYGPDQELLYLQDRGITLKPDLVVLLLISNDINHNVSIDLNGYPKPRFQYKANKKLELVGYPVQPPSAMESINIELMKKSYVYLLLLYAKVAIQDLLVEQDISMFQTIHSGEDRFELAEAILSRIHQVSNEHGASFALLIDDKMPEHLNQFIMEISQRHAIETVELKSIFGDASQTRFPKDGHWNTYGHELAAKGLTTLIQEIMSGQESGKPTVTPN